MKDRIAALEAELEHVSELKNLYAKALVKKAKECAKLAVVLRERDGGIHDIDCKSRREGYGGMCNCGHDDVVKLLAKLENDDG